MTQRETILINSVSKGIPKRMEIGGGREAMCTKLSQEGRHWFPGRVRAL